MKYVNLQSLAGQDALARALEAPSVQRVATGRLKCDDLLGMEERQVVAAFRLVRFYETAGKPKCVKCGGEETYNLRRFERYRCVACSHDFTLTSRTVFANAKLSLRHYLFALSLVIDPTQFKSIRAFTQELKLGYPSTFRTIQKLRIAETEGKDGCTTPYALLQRMTWMELRRRHKPDRLLYGRTGDLRYPYLKSESDMPGAELVKFVNSIVPRWPDADLRADMCQDILLAILTGEATRETVSANVKQYITKVMQASPWKYKWISFDAPLGEDGEGTLHDIISSDDAYHRWDMVNS